MASRSTPIPAVATATDKDMKRLLDPKPHIGFKAIGTIVVLVLVYLWSIRGTDASPAELVRGWPYIWRFLSRLFPIQWQTTDWELGIGPWHWGTWTTTEVLPALFETIQMAIIGSTLSIIISLPFGLLAARNISPHWTVYQTMRFILNTIRAVPEIIIALIFVAAVGLGPFAGVLALAIGSVGTTSKLYAEAIEAIDPTQVQAITATGANRLQTFMYAVVPQALPLVASYSLLLFESNVRSASILGLVGAGGVGLILNTYMALFKYHELMGALLLLIIAVTIIDRVSDYLRRRII
ncbi:MAG TPA: phosphonate ABC transporter, permease protein PhnE [Thermomicrobiales bacterium]|nr:phosphonate ABC transporter, permease protein PhnE [Thermomicrobiales bacterium]